jgi:GH25 family lysozyme M1 (1,4-beta-N-acetylmuramidase)
MQIKGIDVSKHNGVIDWKKVKNAGINFAIIRAGFGSSTVDEKFKVNIEGALNAGLNVGVYWFSYAYTVAKAEIEAKFLLKLIEPYKGKINMPVCFDWEYDSYNYAKKHGVTPTKQLVSDMAIKFLSTIEGAGWYAMNYTNIDYLNRFFNDSVKNRFDTWVAQWASKCSYSGNYGIWQYGAEQNYLDTKYVDGIKGIVDKNIAFKDYPTIIKTNGLNGFKKADTISLYHTVKDNEKLSDILKSYGVTLEEIEKLNADLITGKKIRIK